MPLHEVWNFAQHFSKSGVSSTFYTDETGTAHEMGDTFLVLLKKVDGEWKLYRELASSQVA